MNCCICNRVCGHVGPHSYCAAHAPTATPNASSNIRYTYPTFEPTEQEKFFTALNNGRVFLEPCFYKDNGIASRGAYRIHVEKES
jgi:hypothetical protein